MTRQCVSCSTSERDFSTMLCCYCEDCILKCTKYPFPPFARSMEVECDQCDEIHIIHRKSWHPLPFEQLYDPDIEKEKDLYETVEFEYWRDYLKTKGYQLTRLPQHQEGEDTCALK